MYIEETEIRNFKIYNGTSRMVFASIPGKNVCIVTGDNGRGKTTLLTALVWCLYGRQMQEVDKSYRDRILATGGYRKYVSSCMNKQALAGGELEFSVSVTLKAVELPGVECESMTIKRTYSINAESEILDIKIDDINNELVDEFGRQLFIQEFILPKEIARFFFFDAENIVRMAEKQSVDDRRLLSQAYSEVLGIKRYEDLRRNLNELRIRFRKDSADDVEKAQFRELGKEITQLQQSRRRKESRRESLLGEKSTLRAESDESQDRLLLEGNQISLLEIKQLQDRALRLSEEGQSLMREFSDLLELAPLAIAGSALIDIQRQLEAEERQSKSLADKTLLENRIEAVIQVLRDDMGAESVGVHVDLGRLHGLLREYLIGDDQGAHEATVSILHDFTNEQRNGFDAMVSGLGTRYGDRLRAVSRLTRINRQDYSAISRQLADIHVMETDALVKKYRGDKIKVDSRIRRIDEEAQALSESLGSLENDIQSKERRYEELARKVRVNEEYREKDILANRLLGELDTFIRMIKMKRKESLEHKVLSSINTLLHKKGFIHRVVVEADSNMMDIHLIDGRGQEIGVDTLSKGEQQLYASAILKALVEESGVDFPVLVDSPLQKFDDKHSKSVITRFYPQISKQVILLPLLNRELAKEDYELLGPHVSSAFVIESLGVEASRFRQVEPGELFTESTAVAGATSND